MNFQKSKVVFLPVLILFLIGILIGCSKSPKTASSTVSHISSAAKSSKTSSSEIPKVSSAPQFSSSQAVSSKPSQTSKTSSVQKPPAKQQTVPKASPAPQFSKYITLTIDASKGGDGVVASGRQVGINAGDSVYTALKRYCDANKIILSGSSNYVSAIDGVAEFDNGSQSGWIYSVNGTFAQVGCNSYKLNGGENVKWIYTIDDGKTEERR